MVLPGHQDGLVSRAGSILQAENDIGKESVRETEFLETASHYLGKQTRPQLNLNSPFRFFCQILGSF